MENGNATMAIWLGKQYLGQSDKISQQMTGSDGGPISLLLGEIKGRTLGPK
jgi:hypothetical protein